MIEALAQYVRTNYPKCFDMLKRNTLLRYIYFLPNEMYMKRRKDSIQKYGYEVIAMIYDVAKELQLDIWIDGGTLLGYVRESVLMKHDYDVDFALYSLDKAVRRHLLEALKMHGCTLVRGVDDGEKQYTDSFEYKGVIFDFNYYFKGDGYSYYYEHDVNLEHGIEEEFIGREGKIVYIHGYDIYKCIVTDDGVEEGRFFNGCPCVVPKNAARRLEEIYGSNWRVPIVQAYDWRRDRVFEVLGFRQEVNGWKIK